MQGGINNAGLFGASQREARSKLDQMAGIKRPSGILASSPELMRSVAGPTMMPQPPQQQPAPMPTNMPTVQPALQAIPMPTAVAPMAQAPAPRPLNPMAPTTAGQQPVVKLEDGGFLNSLLYAPKGTEATVSLSETGPINSAAVNIFKTAMDFVQDMDKKTEGAVTEQFGSIEAAAKEGTRKASIIDSAAEATEDPSKIADAVVVAAGEQPTEAAKMDFAENVFGLKDVNDIDEINRRIANVAIGGSVAKSPEEFTQAVLLGLQAYKQTASARAAAKTGGTTGFTKDRTALRAYQDTLDSLTRSLSDRDLPEGYTGSVADYAAEQALKQVMRTYPTDQIPPQLLGQGGEQGGGGGSVTVTTQADFDALPSGSVYIDSEDGKSYTKP